MTKQMIKPEQIPDEAVRKVIELFYRPQRNIREAIAAAINAWPHAHHVNHHEWMKTGELASFDVVLPVILPLPQEKDDD